VECRGLAPNEWAKYLEFARRAWGIHSPQADQSFLTWLYKENPNTLGIDRDLLVLVEGSHIVGAHSRMRVPWLINRQRFVVPSLHDLFVLSSYRSQGKETRLVPPGLQLMLAALENEDHVALFGLADVADKIYERMRIPCVKLFWLRKIRSWMKTGLQIAVARLGWTIGNGWQVIRKTNALQGYEISRMAVPTSDELVEALTVKPSVRTYPDWDLASYRWRFFHDLGPKSIMFLARRSGEVSGRGVISIGLKNGVFVARIVDLVFQDSECLTPLLEEIERTFCELRVSVGLTVTASSEVADHFRRAGWDYRKGAISTRWFTRKGVPRPEDFSVNGGAWDFGCDARI